AEGEVCTAKGDESVTKGNGYSKKESMHLPKQSTIRLSHI
nr:hypothetical protein [Tanacetum cinerariifolium]